MQFTVLMVWSLVQEAGFWELQPPETGLRLEGCGKNGTRAWGLGLSACQVQVWRLGFTLMVYRDRGLGLRLWICLLYCIEIALSKL